MGVYYDGVKLLSMKDINGDRPEIYMCTSNRNGGKTTYFNKLCVNNFKKGRGKFMLLYRYNYELDDVADKFFKDVGQLFFPDNYMRSEKRAKGIYHELFLCNKIDTETKNPGISCGYAVSINSADQIKKISHLFSDTCCMLFDEFQSETDHYCDKEVEKFQSIHTSVARGQGKQVRYVPVYMISNPVSLINPYYTELGISERLSENTKFLKGEGFVLEQGFVEAASEAQKQSAFNRAFKNSTYTAYSSQCVYLNDNKAFIEKPEGPSRYLATIKYNSKEYGIREYAESGIIYCDDRPDVTYKYKLAVTTEDHQVNYVMLKRNDMFIMNLRYYFEHGCFRFKNLRCKEAVLKAISY